MAKDDYARTPHVFTSFSIYADSTRLQALFAWVLLILVHMEAEAVQIRVADYSEAAAKCQTWVNEDPKRRRCWYYSKQVCGLGCLRGQRWNTYWRRWQDWNYYRFSYWGCKANRPPDGVLYPTATGWIDGAHPYEVCPVPPPALPDKQLGSSCSRRSGQGATVGNPCDAGTGNKSQTESDLVLPGTGLSFVRYYNSGTNSDVGLGRGWSSSLHTRLEIGADTLMIRSPDGRGEPWSASSGLWQGDPDSRFLLRADASGYELNLPDGRVQLFDSEGRLQKERTVTGQETNYSYDATGRLSRVIGPFGHEFELAHDASGHLIELRDPVGNIYRYVYDEKDNLVAAVYPDATPSDVADNPRRHYLYENRKYPNLLTGIRDEEGNRYATFAYDDAGRAISTEHAVTSNGIPQERFLLSYDSALQATVTDPAGARWVYQFEENLGARNLVSKTNLSDGKVLTQTFDANNNLVASTDEEGRTTTYTYNEYNQRISKTEAVGTLEARTTRYEYFSPHIDLPIRIVEPSIVTDQYRETLRHFDDSLNLLSTTELGYQPDGTQVSRVKTFEYNRFGQVVRIDGPRTDMADVTEVVYHECVTGGQCGQVASIKNALGQTTTYGAYNASGQVTRMTDPNGLITMIAYDARGRMVSLEQAPPSGQVPNRVYSYVYDGNGRVRSLTSPNDAVVTYEYDGAGDLRTVTDVFGNRVEYRYDLKGNRTTENTLDPDGVLVRAVEFGYDLRDYLKSLNEAGSVSQFTHDAAGNLNSSIDANLNPATRHNYDPLGRLRETIDASSNVTTFGYDVSDRLVEVRAPNGAFTAYKYDDLGNRLEEDSPDRGRIEYAYDSAGNIASVVDARGVRVEYGYDSLNRIIAIDYPGVEEDVFVDYDVLGTPNRCANGTGKICQIQDAAGVTTFTYDIFGNVVQRTQIINGVEYVTAFTYDAGNRIDSIAYPDGRVVQYARDAVGRVTGASVSSEEVVMPVVSDVNYRADGKMTSQRFGNGLSETRIYDLQGRLVIRQLGAISTANYVYDPNGNLLSLDLDAAAARFDYDSMDRLVGDSTNGGVTFGYDENGNRLTEVAPEGTVVGYFYEPGTNQLNEVNNAMRLYDPAGRLIEDGAGETFVYNQSGRLSEVYRAGLRLAEYTYNAMGQRVVKVDHTASSSHTTIYHYDLSGKLIAETSELGEPRQSYIWRGNEPIARMLGAGGNEAALYLHTDHLQTPRQATNELGEIVWQWKSDGFGSLFPDEDPDRDGRLTTFNLRFPGQYFDAETGVHFNWNRYYDPKTGRYISSDPIGLDGGFNTYLYALGNPVILFDWNGLDTAGCDIGPFKRFETPCRLECCATHDQCYKNYNCTARSWWNPESPCGQCNVKAVRCFLDCQGDPYRDDPNRSNYFCSRTGKFINIPSSEYPDVPTAECKCRD